MTISRRHTVVSSSPYNSSRMRGSWWPTEVPSMTKHRCQRGRAAVGRPTVIYLARFRPVRTRPTRDGRSRRWQSVGGAWTSPKDGPGRGVPLVWHTWWSSATSRGVKTAHNAVSSDTRAAHCHRRRRRHQRKRGHQDRERLPIGRVHSTGLSEARAARAAFFISTEAIPNALQEDSIPRSRSREVPRRLLP
jgi:hypothetical protein